MPLRFFTPNAFVCLLLITGCTGSNMTVATIGGKQIPVQEFEKMYADNSGGWQQAAASSVDDRRRFLDLFVKYKLKLLEARNQGLLKDTAVQNEIQSYRSSLSMSYMLEKEVIEPGVRKLYDRSLEEIRASHILIRVGADAPPADTLAAYTKAMRIIAMVGHAPFDSLARAFSEDPSAAYNAGDLGWFGQGQMVSEFEDAAYSLKAGEVTSTPVRTKFGYHIIHVVARQPNEGSVRVSHILRKFSENRSDSDSVAVMIEKIMGRIRKKELPFAIAAEEYSQDMKSRTLGGDLGFYRRTGLPPEISSIFFSTPVGSVAAPYRAAYGYHIFTVTDSRPPPAFQEIEKKLREQYQQSYYSADFEEYIQRLFREYRLNFNIRLRYDFVHSFDSTAAATKPRWSETLNPEWIDQNLFTYGTKNFTVGDFINHVDSSQEFSATLLTAENVEEMIERISLARILEEHASTVEKRFPAFAHLMREYEEGTLIYRIDQDEVWNRIAANDSVLHDYYQANLKRFRWPLRVQIGEIFVPSKALADSIYELLAHGSDFDSLAARFTQRPGMKEKNGRWDYMSLRTNALSAIAVSMRDDSIALPIQYEGGWSIIKKLGKLPVTQKTYEEALPEISSQYREYAAKVREEAWIDSLKKKYRVELNEDVLKSAFARKQSDE